MSAEDYFDFQDFEPDENDDVQCSRCKARGFHWQTHYSPNGAGKWRLFTEGGRLHKCGPQPDADAFDVVSE